MAASTYSEKGIFEYYNAVAKRKTQSLKTRISKQKFAELEKLITKNATVRDFQSLPDKQRNAGAASGQHGHVQRGHLESYLKVNSELLVDLIAKDEVATDKKQKIVDQAPQGKDDL